MSFIYNNISRLILSLLAVMFLWFVYYSIVGTNGNIKEITKRAPIEMPERGWEIMRYEGYQYGNFGKHGGRAWYHVRNIDNHSIQYRIQVTLWGGKLEYWYGKPETLNRLNIIHNYK